MSQREYPADTIPQNAYSNATRLQAQNTSSLGYYLSTPWQSLGPTISGSGAGRVASVKYDPFYDPINRPYIYVAAHGGGVWKSTDGGNTFTAMDNGLPSQSSGDICIDPNNPQIIYYATGGTVDNFQYNYYGFGVFKSIDGGNTWTGGYNTGLPSTTYSYRICVNPNNSNIVYLAERTGLFVSTNGGINWFRPAGVPWGYCQDVVTSNNTAPTYGSRVYAVGGYGTGIGYWMSTDYGMNWAHMTNSGFWPQERTQIAISKENDDFLYAVTNGPGLYAIAFMSTDGGVTFPTSRTLGPTDAGMHNDFLFIQASPSNHLIAVAGYGGYAGNTLYRTIDGGATFPSIAQPTNDLNCFAFNPYNGAQNEALLGSDQGLHKSTDLGSSWPINLNNSLALSESYRVSSYYDANANIILTGVEDGGFSITTNGGTLWQITDWGGDGTTPVISQLDPIPYWDDKHVVVSKGLPGSNYTPDFNYSPNAGLPYPFYFYATDITGYYDGVEDWIAPIKEDPNIAGVFFCPMRERSDHSQININITNNYGQHWEKNHNDNNFLAFNTGDICESPQTFTMCEADTNICYISTVDFEPADWGCALDGPELWKTTDAGRTPWIKLPIHTNGIPIKRYISSVVTDPINSSIVYMTLSGFGTSHVFKSYDGGQNWVDINGMAGTPAGLPDIPVNALVLRRLSASEKQLIIATDIGVYTVTEIDNSGAPYVWLPYSTNLPHATAMDLNINSAAGKIRVATFGRGIFQSDLTGPLVIAGTQNLMKGASDLNVNEDIIVCSGGTLKLPTSSTIRMKEGTKITVQAGGSIDCSSGNAVTFTSQSGTWRGFEFQGNSSSTLNNCTFQNTATPILIDNPTSFNPANIAIRNCTFTNSGPVVINNRGNVTVSQCTWNYSSTIDSQVCGVSVIGSGTVIVQGNTINYAASTNKVTGISVVQSSTTSVTSNIIRNTSIGIFASNSDPNIRYNNIGSTGATNADIGIGLDNCPNAYILYDTIASYVTGISLVNGSSPVMHDNKITGSTSYGMFCNSNANPRLTPTIDNGVVYWDGGLNILETTTSGGDGIWLSNFSTPNMAEGYNTVWGGNCYIDGSGSGKWSVADNCWVDNPPANKYCVTGFQRLTTTPYSCTPPPGAGGIRGMGDGYNGENIEAVQPPQPLIVDLGNGVYDTLRAVNSTTPVNADLALYYTGTKQALQSNFTDAINTYKQVIQSYHDSTSAIESMKKIFYCYGRMHADTNTYADLRNYYLSLSSADTSFSKTASELSRKCLVKKLELENAIGEYETAVQHSNNHADSVSAEVNIIEVYMLMQNHGGNSRFTGRIANLKPLNVIDGIRMIKEKLYNLGGKLNNVEVPKTFSLSQNYPNPFNPMTTIKYGVPQPVKVTIKIYDILGRVVKSLVNDEFEDAGFYEIRFDGSNFASGVYFYRIEAGKFVQSKKMVIVK